MNEQSPKEKFDFLMQTDAGFRANVFEIGAAFFHNVVRDGVRRGDLSLTDKSRAEAIKEVCDYVRAWAASDFTLVEDHRPELLTEAKRAKEEGRWMIATILLATYFEHALNDLILAGCARSNIEMPIALRLVKSSFPEKIGSLLEDVGLPALPEKTAKAIRALSKLRNEFVHYEWVGRNDRESKERAARVAEIFGTAESAVQEFETYEKSTLLVGFEELFVSVETKTPGAPKPPTTRHEN